jgi:hypothetical protein
VAIAGQDGLLNTTWLEHASRSFPLLMTNNQYDPGAMLETESFRGFGPVKELARNEHLAGSRRSHVA